MKEITLLIGKDKSTVTALVNKLSKRGYVQKEKGLEDKRVTCVNVTEKGEEIKHKFSEISSEVYNVAYKDFTEEEKETLLRLLKKMNKNFS
jgi:DNA-binding MarR family transcriptional regulator